MKRKVILLLMICLVVLTGCGDNGEKIFLKFAENVGAAGEISFTAKVRAEYSDKTAEFTLDYEQDSEGTEIEIVEPETVKGIKAKVSNDGLSLEYEGAILDIGKLTDRGLSPVSALPLLAGAMKDAHIDLVWTEENLVAARLIPADDTVVTLWISSDLVPQNAEITYKDQTLVYIEISDWEVG